VVLRLSKPDDFDRLCAFLTAARFVVRRQPDGTVGVNIPGAASRRHEEQEVVGYVTTWNALNPGSRVGVDVLEP
jgi:hypothetical protein